MSERNVIGMIRFVARATVVVMAVIWTLFAVLSGAGDDIAGFLQNLPNALPWLVLVVVVAIAFRWELAGAMLLLMLGGASVTFFDAWTAPIVFFGVCLPITAAGAGLFLCHFLDQSDT